MQTPFISPAEAHRNALPFILEAANKINGALAAGQRVFYVLRGHAEPIREALNEAGWTGVEVRPHAADPDGMRTIVICDG